MNKIKNLERVTTNYNDWKPTDIAFIKSLEWSVSQLEIVFYSQLRAGVSKWPDTSRHFFEMSITFKNISMLKLDFSGGGLQQVLGFDILDISNSGFEKNNFQIEDYENDCISFFCEEIEINKVLNLEQLLIF